MPTHPTNVPPSPARPRLRFTLRLLLAAITLLCLALGWWTHRAREQRGIVRAIEQSEYGQFYYDYQFKRGGFRLPRETSKLPKSLIDLFGPDYFHAVTFVSVRRRELVPDISKLHGVVEIEINDPSLTDQDLIPITRMHTLQELMVNWPWHPRWPKSESRISDETLRRIGQMTRIVDVNIGSHRLTRNGVEALAKAQTLEHADFDECLLIGEELPFEIVRGTQVFVVEHNTANGTSAPYGTRMDRKWP